MSATTASAIKAYVESKGLGLSVYRDVAPSAVRDGSGQIVAPYCTVIGEIGGSLDPQEDGGPANGGVATGTELVQLDLWQRWIGANGQVGESTTLSGALSEVLAGAKLPTAPKLVYGVRLLGLPVRTVERDANIVHHSYTLAVRRVI